MDRVRVFTDRGGTGEIHFEVRTVDVTVHSARHDIDPDSGAKGRTAIAFTLFRDPQHTCDAANHGGILSDDDQVAARVYQVRL